MRWAQIAGAEWHEGPAGVDDTCGNLIQIAAMES
jgi:hypothetical protein